MSAAIAPLRSAPLSPVHELVLRHALPIEVRQQAVSGPAGAALVQWARDEGLTGLAWAAVTDGVLELDDACCDALRAAHTTALRTTLTCEAVAAEVVGVCTTAGVDTWLLKGLSNGNLDYPDPAQRNSSDVDLMVRRADLAPITAVLEHHGFHRAEPGLSPWWEQRFGRAIVFQSPDGVEIDVHAAFAVGYFGARLTQRGPLAGVPARIDLGGTLAFGLTAPARLLFTSYSAVLGRGGQARLHRDIAQLLLVTCCDWRATVALAAEGDGEAVIARALHDTATTIGIDPSHPAMQWATTVRPSRQARRALDLADIGRTEGWSADARSSLLALGPVDRVRFLAGLAVPPAANRRMRERTLGQHVARAASLIRRRA